MTVNANLQQINQGNKNNTEILFLYNNKLR